MASVQNVLGASSLTSIIASSLPKDASPQLKTATDAIAVACHAGMLAVGFKLSGLGEEHRIGGSASGFFVERHSRHETDKLLSSSLRL